MFEGSFNISHAVEKWESFVNDFSSAMLPVVGVIKAKRTFVKWDPPEGGRVAINVDDAWIRGESAAAMVVRDTVGKVLLVASSRFPASSAEVAELKGLIWAMALADTREWHDIDWRIDAKEMVRRALSRNEPRGWFTRNDYLLLQRNLLQPRWSLSWVPREANGSADVAAKLSLKSNRDFFFVDFNFLSLPAEIVFQLLAEDSGYLL